MHALLFFVLLVIGNFCDASEQLLKNNLEKAQTGQYLVTAQNKNISVLLVEKKEGNFLEIHEVTVPSSSPENQQVSWKQWINTGFPGNTSWILYKIHIPSGTIQNTYSYSRKEWITIPQAQSFLTTLLNLQFAPIPDTERKRIGPSPKIGVSDHRPFWSPPMIIEGNKVPGVPFKAWRTLWPKDGSELSGRTIEVYTPEDSDKYPSYFPYWLQVSGLMGNAKIRIIDSGTRIP